MTLPPFGSRRSHFSRRTVLRTATAATLCPPAWASDMPGRPAVSTGFMCLRDRDFKTLRGRRLGLIGNPTTVDETLQPIADILHQRTDLSLVALFGPEHGFRGTAQAGAAEAQTIDRRTGLPAYDLYGKHGVPLERLLHQADVDLLIFDIQDIGARFYTYIWTLFDVMAACARLQLPLIVLDRPNPLGGLVVSGPILAPGTCSFVGRAPIALRHGMTIGELARLFNTTFIPAGNGRACPLTVIPMRGWRRSADFSQTGLPWVPPSPNMPTLETAFVYPGTCLFEGTSYSVGRGTSMPFITIGRPEKDGSASHWAEMLRRQNFPGVLFRETWFTPTTDVAQGALCHGISLTVTDRNRFDPVRTGLAMLRTAPDHRHETFWRDGGKTFSRLAGRPELMPLIRNDAPSSALTAVCQRDMATFETRRSASLLY